MKKASGVYYPVGTYWTGTYMWQSHRHPIRWDSAILELVPQYCQKCEGKVEEIRVFYDEIAEMVYVTCGRCRFMVSRVTLKAVEDIKRAQKLRRAVARLWP